MEDLKQHISKNVEVPKDESSKELPSEDSIAEDLLKPIDNLLSDPNDRKSVAPSKSQAIPISPVVLELERLVKKNGVYPPKNVKLLKGCLVFELESYNINFPLKELNPHRIEISEFPSGPVWVKVFTTADVEFEISERTFTNHYTFKFRAVEYASQFAKAFQSLVLSAGGKGDMFAEKKGIVTKKIGFEKIPATKKQNIQRRPTRSRTSPVASSKYKVGDKVGSGSGLGGMINGWRGVVVSKSGKTYRIRIVEAGTHSSFEFGKTYDFVESEFDGTWGR